jgi:prepilin-type N-terminal cleavage/methylation domain-containing protein
MKHQSGVSLVELLVALGIASVVFAVLASSQVLGFRVTRESAEVSQARDLATKQMELIRAFGFNMYNLCPTSLNPDAVALSSSGSSSSSSSIPTCKAENQPTGKSGYTMSWTINNQPTGIKATTPKALVSVNVTVSYKGNKSYTLSTYLSCADAGDFALADVRCPDASLLN